MFNKIHTIDLPFVNIDVLEHDGNKVNSIAELPHFRLPVKLDVLAANFFDTDKATEFKDVFLNFRNVQPITTGQDAYLAYSEWQMSDEDKKRIQEAKKYLIDTLKYSFELGSLSKMTIYGNKPYKEFSVPSTQIVDAMWNCMYAPYPTGSSITFDPDDLGSEVRNMDPPNVLLELGNGVVFSARKMNNAKRRTSRIYGQTTMFGAHYVFSFYRTTNPMVFRDLISREILADAYRKEMDSLCERMNGLFIPHEHSLFFDAEFIGETGRAK